MSESELVLIIFIILALGVGFIIGRLVQACKDWDDFVEGKWDYYTYRGRIKL